MQQITEWLDDKNTTFRTGYLYGFKLMTNRQWLEREANRLPGSRIVEGVRKNGRRTDGSSQTIQTMALFG